LGVSNFYERKEVKDAVAYLRVIDNPGDEASLLRIINFPRRGIGDTTLVKLNQWSLEHTIPLFDALGRVAEIPEISESAKKAVAAFHAMMKGVIGNFDTRTRLGEQVNALFNRLRIEDEIYRTLNDAVQARKRIENIEQVVNSLAGFEEQNPRSGLYLHHSRMFNHAAHIDAASPCGCVTRPSLPARETGPPEKPAPSCATNHRS